MKQAGAHLSSLVFLVLMALSLRGINKVLEPNFVYENSWWPSTSSFHEFYQMPRNSLDVIFLGSSTMASAMCPQVVYDETGIRSYNLASDQQSILISSYWLEEALRFQHPRAFVVDVKYMFEGTGNPVNTSEPFVRKALDTMKLSPVKIRAVSEICRLENQSRISYYLTNIRFHDRWKVLERGDLNLPASLHCELMGFVLQQPVPGSLRLAGWAPPGEEEILSAEAAVPRDNMMTGLERMARDCRDSGVPLVLLNLPGNYLTAGQTRLMRDFAAENGLRFVNMEDEEVLSSFHLKGDEAFFSHADGECAARQSAWVAHLLHEELGIEGCREERYEQRRAYYAHAMQAFRLKKAASLREYLEIAGGDPSFSVLFSLRFGMPRLREEDQQALFGFGLATDLRELPEGATYVAAKVGDQVREKAWTEPLEMEGRLQDPYRIYRLTSSNATFEGTSKVEVEGMETCLNLRGLNIVVFDELQGKATDAVCLATEGDGLLMR